MEADLWVETSASNRCFLRRFRDLPTEYYVFMVGDPGNSGDPLIGLHYSVVDMSLQGGLGDVIPQPEVYLCSGRGQRRGSVNGNQGSEQQ